MHQGRAQFLALVQEVRPELHRYCARMTGSIADGEDVVQDTLARAYFELAELNELPPLRPWLFRIAHNRAIDVLRSREYRKSESLDATVDMAGDAALEPGSVWSRADDVHCAVSRFMELPATQRSCVILMDVLEYSLEEMADMLDLSVPAIKAALHRGRTRLRALAQTQLPAPARRLASPTIVRYAALFNAHDWDGVRAMLVDDVRLDLVGRMKATGRDALTYFTNYAGASGWGLAPAWLDGREVLAVYRDRADPRPGYFIELEFIGDRIIGIRDFRYVPYIASEAEFVSIDTGADH
ncbi:sigma-70 family RNA polymerase sigma factor [Silvimonas amylolytica]|uniref:DNA-directed RNA polymerase sigma-70 factor n=1 Tax=Silvimonas amylolytica TaxID=449663 RepID=A0ABQ2PJ89_9NEIS|nr:sigma-70 family RNA polymerase sigma factor [Silvimonas amylolytica]GGP25305.1 DNA-directed RNA polymerase sigma-70 factor [Silvimonas amylolytica]